MIYFIQSGDTGPIKIGYSVNPISRLQTLQTSHHERLRLIVSVAGTPELEAALHVHFVEQRLVGEWFSITTGDVLEVINEIFKETFGLERIEKETKIQDLSKILKNIQNSNNGARTKLDFAKIKQIFNSRSKIFSDELASKLGYSKKELSILLSVWLIKPRNVRVGDCVARGYYASDFLLIWEALDNLFIVKAAM
jgi:hypothetical protein